jgi:hypothetical protein
MSSKALVKRVGIPNRITFMEGQKRRIWLVLLVGLGCALCLAFLSVGRTHEPSFNGRPLHSWINDLNKITFQITSTNGITLAETNASITAILGTAEDATPWLKAELNARESVLRKKVRTIAYHLPQKIGVSWVVEQLGLSKPTAPERHRRAALAALILGQRGTALVPNLAELLNSGDCRQLSAFALARMGGQGAAALAWALTNTAPEIQQSALYGLWSTDADLEPAVPAFFFVLTNHGGFLLTQQVFGSAQHASNAVDRFVQAASHHTNWIFRENASATLQAFKSRSPASFQKQGWLRLDQYGGGSYEF